MGEEKNLFIHVEVDKLVDANFFKEIKFQTWVVNPVLVNKSNNRCMCVEFRYMNKACLKDCYPLPHIEGCMEYSFLYRW